MIHNQSSLLAKRTVVLIRNTLSGVPLSKSAPLGAEATRAAGLPAKPRNNHLGPVGYAQPDLPLLPNEKPVNRTAGPVSISNGMSQPVEHYTAQPTRAQLPYSPSTCKDYARSSLPAMGRLPGVACVSGETRREGASRKSLAAREIRYWQTHEAAAVRRHLAQVPPLNVTAYLGRADSYCP